MAEPPPADEAARLTAASAGEPRGATARLTGEMTHPPTDHATHDELLIAGLLDRSPGDPDRDRAEALVAGCDDCAALHRDLVALSTATRALPTPPRPRDFTLSADDVERLRPKGWRRLIAAFGSSRDIFSRPLAIGLTTLGLAGLLVATIPGVLSGQGGASAGAGANPEPLGASSRAMAAPSAGPSAAAAALVAPSAEPSTLPFGPTYDNFVAGPVASGGAAAVTPESSRLERQGGDDATGAALTPAELPAERSGVIVLASLLLMVGLGLFALRWTARRLRGG